MNYDLLIDLHKDCERQGPGSVEQTIRAIDFSGLKEKTEKLNIADIGCGTGASTIVLAENLNANITAVDFFAEFLNILQERAINKGLANRIKTLTCSMDDLPFQPNSLDAIWSEGAIYIMGFEKGVNYFKSLLKPGGLLAVSEITWITLSRPSEITSYWKSEYPEIATAEEKTRILEENGFTLKGYFHLPETCWLENYYLPLQDRFDAFMSKHNTEEARSLIDEHISEIEMYKKYSKYYSYGFYIAQKALN